MASSRPPNLEGSVNVNSSGVGRGKDAKYSALLEAWSSFGDAKAELDGLEKRVDGAVLLPQKRATAPRVLSSSKPRSPHVVQYKEQRGPSPQRGAGVVKHRQPNRKKKEGLREKENERKDKRTERETDEARKEESIVTLEGSVLNSDSRLNDTFTVSPELHTALQHKHTHTNQGALKGATAAVEEPLGPAKKVAFEQPKEPAGTKTSPRRGLQAVVSPYSLQRTNRSAVFGPPISFKEVGGGKDAPRQGGQERHGDRQRDRGDEGISPQHVHPAHLQNRAGLGPRGVLREFPLPPMATLASLQEQATRQQHAVRETAAVVQSLLHRPPLQPHAVGTGKGESRPLNTGVSSSGMQEGDEEEEEATQGTHVVVRKVHLSPGKGAPHGGRYSGPAPSAALWEGQGTAHAPQHDPFVMYSRHFAHNPSLYSKVDPPVQPHREVPHHAPVLVPGTASFRGGHWGDLLGQEPVERKRKVAMVPPPKPPVGVAVGRRGREGAAPPSRLARMDVQDQAALGRGEERHAPVAHGRRNTAPKAAVRKVAKQHQLAKGGPEKTITPFSWRVGKELSDKVLADLKQVESAKESGQPSDSLMSSAVSQPEGGLGSSVHLSPIRQPPVDVKQSPPHHHRPAKWNAAQLLADMDLQPSEDEVVGEGVESRQQPAKTGRGGRKRASGPPKRPKYNFEPVYNVPKTRHYKPEDVQQYMHKKKEERRKEQDEHKKAAQRQKQLTEQRLQELSQARKERLNVNLAKVYSKQRHPELTFLKQVSAGLSQNASGSMETLSCSDVEESGPEQHPPQPSTLPPAREREWGPPPPHSSSTKGGGLPPQSLSASTSETCSDEDTPTGSELEEVPLLASEENRGRMEITERGALSSLPGAFSMTPVLGAVRHPTSVGPPVHPHALGKGAQTKQDRLRALSISAMTLKAKVEMERKRILEASRMGIIPDWGTRGSPVNVNTRGGTTPGGVSPSTSSVTLPGGVSPNISPRRSIGINTEQQPTEYPGVGNLDTHLLAMRRERKERTAATSIQAAFRGYVVRKAVRGTGRWPNGSVPYSDEGGARMDIGTHKGRSMGSPVGFTTSGAPPQELGGTTAPPTFRPTASPTSRPTAPPTSLGTVTGEGLQPWEQRGGDVHSLVHIIAKQEAKRRRKAAEKALSVPHKGVVESVGVQVDSSELSRAAAGLTGTQGADHHPLGEDDVAPVQEGPGSAVGACSQQQASPQGRVLSPARQASPPAPTATPPAPTAIPPAQTATPPVLTATPLVPTATPPAHLVSMEPDSLAEDSTLDTSTPEVPQPYGSQGWIGLAPTVPPESYGAEEAGRMSPRSLQLKLSAELMLLETAQDQMHHLGEVERARYIALAQRETLSVAQVLKNAHEEEIRALSTKTELELGTVRQQLQLVQDEASVAAVRVKSLERETQVEVDRSTQLMAKLEREARESQLQLAEARKAASEAVIAAARRQLEGAHDRATQTAIVTAKKVEAVLAGQREGDRGTSSEAESCSDRTPSLGEGEGGAMSSTVEESDSGSESQTPTEGSSGKERTVVTASEGDVPEDLDSTLVAGEVEEESASSTTIQEETEVSTASVASPVKSHTAVSEVTPPSQGRMVPDPEQELDEVSFRMVLPSESHRRRQRQDHRPPSPRLSISSSFSSDVASPSPSASSVLLLPDETGVPKELTHASVLSVGDESFDDFTLRMIKQYVRDQDARSRHQLALLKLKERALEEQTKAKLTVLDQWKRRLKKKGDDDHMPVVLKKEKGLMRNYKNAKAEIRGLWQVQHQEKEERRRLLLQQREIGQLRLSAQNYWEKARQLEEDEGNVSVSVSSVSPVSQLSGRLESPLQENAAVRFPPSTSTPFVRTKSPLSVRTSISEEVPEEQEVEEEEGSVAEVFEQTSVVGGLANQSSVLRTVSSAASTPQAGVKSVTGKSVTEEPSRLSSSELHGSRQSEEVEETPPPAGRRGPDRGATRSTTTPSTVEEHPLTHRLNKADYTTTERRLAKRDEQLQWQQKMAEGALAAQQRLLEKEKQLRQKEEQISLLLDQAEELRAQRLGMSSRTTGRLEQTGDGMQNRSSAVERSPRKGDSVRRRRDSLEEEEQSGVGEVPEETMADPPSSMTATSIAEVHSAHPAQGVESVTGEVSEDIRTAPTKGFGEYSHDTFESITTAAGVLTSTPHSMRRNQQVTRDDASSPQRISESPTDITTISSVTTATESSEIEQRIRQLKEDLSHRKEEVRRVQQEQKRRKRGLLQEKEEQLKKKLKALEQKLQGAKQSLSLVVPSNVSVHSTTATESEGEREQQTTLRRERLRYRAHAGRDVTARVPPSVEPSLSYTPFTDNRGTEERVSPAKAGMSGDQSTLVMGEDITLTSPKVKDKTIKTAAEEDESIKTATVADESIKTATVKDETIKSAGVEDKTITSAALEGEAVTPTPIDNVQSELFVGEEPLSAKKTGVTPSASSVKSPTLSSPAHSVQEELHSSSLSSLHRSAKGLTVSTSGKLSPRGSPSRIPIPSRLAHSPQSSSPTTSLRSLKDRKSPPLPRRGRDSEVHSDQDETLQDADSYSETFTAVTASRGGLEETAEDVQGGQTPPTEDEPTTEEEEVLTEVEEQLLSGTSEAELTSSPSPELMSSPSPDEQGTAALAPSALQQEGPSGEVGVEGDVPGAEIPQAVDVLSQLVGGLQVGQNVIVGGAVSGVVRFVGSVHFTSGTFIGVELSEKKGKNDGSFDGVRYFDCPEGHGLFAPPSKVSLLREEKGDTARDILSGPEEEEAASPFEDDRLTPEALLYPLAAPGETEGGRSPSSTESPTPSEVSSLDVEEVVPSDLEEEEEEEEAAVEPQRKEKGTASPEKLNTLNGVASGLMQQLMKELVIDVSAAAQKKRARLALDDRERQRSVMVDSITSDLLGMFLQSEVHLMCNIRNAKKAALDEESAVTAREPPTGVQHVKPSHLPLAAGRVAVPPTYPSAIPGHRLSPEPCSSSLSPPPSPPGSPPRYSARAFAGDRSPPPTLPPDTSHLHVGVAQAERPMSPVSITSLMEEHPFSEVELTILPRDKPSVDKIAEIAWNDYLNTPHDAKDAGIPFKTPKSVLAVRSISSQPTHLITDEEQGCRDSFGHLVYQLSMDVIRELQPAQADNYSPRQSINWKMKMERRKSLVDPPLTLDNVKQIVFARLVEGRLPIRLPKGRYHHGMRRPGGKEVDFLEAILIKELRADECNWTNFEREERDIKLKTADRILDLLLDEVVQEVKAVERKKSHIAHQ